MKSYQIVPALFTILSLTAAQTPAGFTPATIPNLGVAFTIGNVSDTPPGVSIPRADTLNAPNITYTGVANTSVILVIDITNPGATASAPRTTLLTWFQPNATGTLTAGNKTTIFSKYPAGGAPWLQPNPAAGDIPHTYVVLFFNQPKNFSIPAAFSSINPPVNATARVGFNVTAFIKDTGLSVPLAANYFSVVNTTAATSTNSSAPKTTTTASSSSTKATTASTTTTKAANATSSVVTVTKNAGTSLQAGSTVALIMAALFFFAQL